MNDGELYRSGAETVVASWEAYARGTPGAAVERLPGAAVAVFPDQPERAIYNNAVLERELGPAERADAVSAMEAAYAEAGVGRFAAWVHESDQAMRRELERRGYRLDESTRAMGMALEDVLLPRPQLDATPLGWPDSLRLFGLPPGLLASADLSAFRIVAVRIDGEHVAAAMTFDHGDDRGMYNVGTLERAGGAGSARR